MAPLRPSGQLDQISEAIGRLEGKFDGVDRYIHQRVHDDREVSAKIDGLSHQITKEVTRMKAEFKVQLEAMDRRVAALEQTAAGDTRTRNIVAVVVQSPLVGWIAGVIALVWAVVTHGGHK